MVVAKLTESWFGSRIGEMKIERKWKYGHNMPHTLNIFFCRDLKKVHFIFQTPLTVKIEKWWGGYHPLGWNLLKMGGNSPPGGISPPFPFCQIWEGGDITTFLESYAKWGGFHTWGGYHPLVPIWPQSTGGGGRHPLAVCPSDPSKYVRARLDVRLKPVFLWFCPSICDFVHIQSVIVLFGTVKPCELHKMYSDYSP